MRASSKVGIGMLIVMLALIVALWPRGSDELDRSDEPDQGQSAMPTLPSGEGEVEGAPVDGDELAALRADANLEPCPDSDVAPASGPLAGVTLECLADGSPVDLGAALAGKPAVLNLWAHWCAPCRVELPAMEEFAERAGDAVRVLTVHKDKNQAKGLAVLAELGTQLPGVDDPGALVAAAVSAPNVLPVTVLLRADGSVATVLAVPFTDADQIADAVQEHLGVVA